jgi:plasmid maintenance system antidote protein VapI
MGTAKNKTQRVSSVSKELKESQIWNEDKMEKVREFILIKSKKQSPDRKLRNEFLSIKYQIQDYVEKDKIEKEMRIVDFVRLYLKLLRITQKDLASGFEMKDTNLYKYLTGERKLNSDIVLKLSSFSNTEPELWYYIEVKNELHELRKKEKTKSYEKYDYRKLVKLEFA